ncbi:DinB family protein [Candidatus Eisenbacteria bacterium]|uniref:DinB family protein n=1 Tax=Eiseniibacteriota bacterium TaxID=2212470 RepID=A0ABV6YI49_UNCEI
MIQRTPWFERTFRFDQAVAMFPLVVERLRGTPARLEDRLGSLSGRLLTTRTGDSWTIQENVGHLLDLEPLWTGRIEDLVSSKATLQPADLENRKTHDADHNTTPIQALLVSFRRARMDMVAILDSLDESAIARVAMHPRLETPMRMLDLAVFVAEHDDHHIARISELIHAAGK